MFCTCFDLDNGGSVEVFLHIMSMALGQRGVGAILGNRYGIQGQNYVGLLLGSEISAGFHYRNLIFDM